MPNLPKRPLDLALYPHSAHSTKPSPASHCTACITPTATPRTTHMHPALPPAAHPTDPRPHHTFCTAQLLHGPCAVPRGQPLPRRRQDRPLRQRGCDRLHHCGSDHVYCLLTAPRGLPGFYSRCTAPHMHCPHLYRRPQPQWEGWTNNELVGDFEEDHICECWFV